MYVCYYYFVIFYLCGNIKTHIMFNSEHVILTVRTNYYIELDYF